MSQNLAQSFSFTSFMLSYDNDQEHAKFWHREEDKSNDWIEPLTLLSINNPYVKFPASTYFFSSPTFEFL